MGSVRLVRACPQRAFRPLRRFLAGPWQVAQMRVRRDGDGHFLLADACPAQDHRAQVMVRFNRRAGSRVEWKDSTPPSGLHTPD